METRSSAATLDSNRSNGGLKNTLKAILEAVRAGQSYGQLVKSLGFRPDLELELVLADLCQLGAELRRFQEAVSDEGECLERLAALEHEQWELWSKAVAEEVREERRARWEFYWKPYEELPEHAKDQDRIWARRVVRTIRSYVYGGR